MIIQTGGKSYVQPFQKQKGKQAVDDAYCKYCIGCADGAQRCDVLCGTALARALIRIQYQKYLKSGCSCVNSRFCIICAVAIQTKRYFRHSCGYPLHKTFYD